MSTKTIVILVVGAIGALGMWKMIDDLIIFRRTVEARFAAPPSHPLATRSAQPKGRFPRRVSQEANLRGDALMASAPGFGTLPVYDDPPSATLSLESDIERGPARSKARAAADAFVAERRAAWGIREYHELRGEEYPGPLGTEVRYKVYQDGLEVLGLEMRVEVDAAGAATESGNNYLPMAKADLSAPELAPDEALRRSGLVQDGDVSSAAMSARRVLFAGSGSEEPEVGYAVSLGGDGTGASSAILRAGDGQPLARNFARR